MKQHYMNVSMTLWLMYSSPLSGIYQLYYCTIQRAYGFHNLLVNIVFWYHNLESTSEVFKNIITRFIQVETTNKKCCCKTLAPMLNEN